MKRVVVTGMGCVSPVGNTVPAFWDSLCKGRHGFAPIKQFDTTGMKVTVAAEVKDFDPTLYMEKSDLRKTDVYAQFAMAAAAQAMDDAGLDGKVAPEKLGVYIGSGIGGFHTMATETEKMLTRGPGRISPFFVPMMISNIAAALVAMRYQAQGPCLPVVTACSTATNAIGEAFRAIKDGYAEAVIAGGSEAAITPLAIGGFTSCMALSTRNDPDTASIPFDARRDGFVMGEGAGVLVLESRDHALARGAQIYAEIVGYGHTCDAYHITAPHPEAAGSARMIRQTFEEAGLSPTRELYVNPHGTSTPLNDKVETLALKLALGEDVAYHVPISSTKSMTGHMLGAAGGVEAIAAIQALRTGIVPPTVGLQQADPDCDLDYVPGTARVFNPQFALSLSLGFGGHNAGLLFRRP